jgi:hypothetical protein
VADPKKFRVVIYSDVRSIGRDQTAASTAMDEAIPGCRGALHSGAVLGYRGSCMFDRDGSVRPGGLKGNSIISGQNSP